MALYVKDLLRRPMTCFALIIIFGVFFCAAFADFISPYSYLEGDLMRRFEPPSLEHPFGRDHLGRDILSRIIYGTRLLLYVIGVTLLIAISIGILLGLFSGYIGGIVDQLVSRIIDTLLSFPTILLALAIVAVLGPGLENSAIAIGIAEIPVFARLTRGLTFSEREALYVEAARVIGASRLRIIFKHILPNISGPIIVQATFSSVTAILWAAALGFLGLGAQPPTPCWGTMLFEAKGYLRTAPHAFLFPGLAIFMVAFSINVVGEALRDYMDPRMRVRG